MGAKEFEMEGKTYRKVDGVWCEVMNSKKELELIKACEVLAKSLREDARLLETYKKGMRTAINEEALNFRTVPKAVIKEIAERASDTFWEDWIDFILREEE